MEREINCVGCSAKMGVIRDAALRKDIRYLCDKCNSLRMDTMLELKNLKERIKKGGFGGSSIFGDIFAGRFPNG